MNYISILLALLPYMGYALLGVVCNRIGISRGKPEKYLLFMLINIMVPVLSFNFIIGNPAINDIGNIASAPFVGFFSIVAGFFIARYTARLFGIKRDDSVKSFAFSVGMYNYVFYAVPLAMVLYGDEVVGILLVHNLGNEIAVWSVGAGMLAGSGLFNPMKILQNPPILAIVASLIINFLTGGAPMPPMLKSFASIVATLAIPAGLFISGATLAGNMGLFAKKDGLKITIGSLALRMFVIPLFVVCVVAVLPVPAELKMVTAIQASMPAGMSTVVIVKYFNGDAESSVPVIIATTVASIFTMPLWITVFQRILGV
jgi:predicted permease